MTPREAVALQLQLRERVIRRRTFRRVRRLGGVDVSVRENRSTAAIVVMSYPELELLEQATAERPVDFPYVPGLLAFREIPVLLMALDRLTVRPDLLLVDGHGLAHPRRFGIACHLGVRLDLPTIGCGKSLFVGEHAALPPLRGSRVPLLDQGEEIGAVLRTRDGVRPIYVSIGHRVDLKTGVQLVLGCCTRFRLPDPIRYADALAGGRM